MDQSWIDLIARHHETLREHIDRRFHALQQELHQMAGTLSEQLDAATAAIRQDVQNVSDEVAKLLAGITPGSTITQAQVDALTAIDTALKAIPPAP